MVVEIGYTADPNVIGNQVSNELKNYYMKDSSNINDKLFSPGVDPNKDLVTIEGESGKAALSCMSEVPFAEVEYHPVAGNDIDLTIREDLDDDGVLEHVVSINGVSAVCLTGVLSCTNGTSQDCGYIAFNVSPSGGLGIAPAEPYSPKMAVCYFINASGGNLSVNFPNGVSKILDDIGGLVSNLTASVLNFNGVTAKKDYANFKITLYGSSPSSCVESNVSTIEEAKSFYNGGTDDTAMMGEVDKLKAGLRGDLPIDGEDPASAEGVYQYVSTLPSVTNSPPPDVVTCGISNVVTITTESKQESCWNQIFVAGKEYCIRDISTNCDLGYPPGESTTCRYTNYVDYDGPVKHYSGVFSGIIHPTQEGLVILEQKRSKGDKGVYFEKWLDISGDYTASVHNREEDQNWYNVPDSWSYFIPSDPTLERNLTINWEMEFFGKGSNTNYPGKYYYAMFLVTRDYKQDKRSVSKIDTCSWKVTPECTLMKEWVCNKDGDACIQTFDATNPIPDVNISPFCYSESTELNTYNICADGNQITATSVEGSFVLSAGDDSWFLTKREYLCPKTGGDPSLPGDDFFDDAVKTRESVYTDSDKSDFNYNPASGEFSYVDYGNGGVSRTSSILPMEDSCNKVCRVKVLASQDPSNVDSTQYASYNPEPVNGSDIVTAKQKMDCLTLKQCENGVCPVGTNEQLIEDCFCLDTDDKIDLESLADIETVYDMSKDIICSSSPP